MPEAKPGQKTIEGVTSDNHYPSSVDNMIRNDTPFEGSSSGMPSESPIGSGSLPTSKITKVK